MNEPIFQRSKAGVEAMQRVTKIWGAAAGAVALICLSGAILTPVHGEESASGKTAAESALGKQSAQQAKPEPARKKKGPSAANSFNRLLKRPASKSNAPPAEDGIHDPASPGTHLLQWPSEAFQDLPKSTDGNRVDWVKAMDDDLIHPWVEFEDPEAEPFLMDLVIVREVKGSMPDVVYPHLQHTKWLDCANCHDEIFIPEKGKNQISMAAILLGQKCGVCHGKVAFPVSDCRRCHAKPKSEEQLRALAERAAKRRRGSASEAR